MLRAFQNQIAAIQRDAVWWLHSVVPTISKVGPKDYVHWYVGRDTGSLYFKTEVMFLINQKMILLFGQPPQGAFHGAA